jgi:hypothetical protein
MLNGFGGVFTKSISQWYAKMDIYECECTRTRSTVNIAQDLGVWCVRCVRLICNHLYSPLLGTDQHNVSNRDVTRNNYNTLTVVFTIRCLVAASRFLFFRATSNHQYKRQLQTDDRPTDKVKVTLRPTTSRSVRLGFEPRLGLMTRC